MQNSIDCFMCGACCTAYDISTLKKPAGIRCAKLTDGGRCGDYKSRPAVCSSFKPDELCVLISTLSFEEKLAVLKMIYYDDIW